MARVEGLEQKRPGVFVRFMYRAVKRRLGKVSESLRIAANLESVFFTRGIYELILERSSLVNRRVRMLAQIKAGMVLGCPA